MVAVAVPCFFCALFDFIRCEPVAHVWDPTVDGTCWISTEGFTSLSLTVGGKTQYQHSQLDDGLLTGNIVASASADFVLAVLPWFILWNLQMRRKEKILIASSMSLGFLYVYPTYLTTIPNHI